MYPSQTEVKRSSFPKDFIFGGATSAYQVEGAWNVGGKGLSNWDYMTEHEPDSIEDRSDGKVAIDHYNMFKEDVDLMKRVGLDSYRFSISWSRILPGGKSCAGTSKEGIKFYNDLIDALLDGGIEPCATIFHWDVPQCLEDEYGGFLDHQIVEHFCDFAEICFKEFGDRVKYWITLNEPWSFTFCGYVVARFPPRRGYTLGPKLEPVMRSSILHHRSAIDVPPCIMTGHSSSERDPIAELVDVAYNLPYDTSPEGDSVRELVAKAYNFPYSTSEGDANDSAMAYDYFFGTSSEGNSDRKFIGDPGTEPYIVAHNLILAHAHAVDIYRKSYQKRQQGKIGMTNVSIWYYPLDEDNPEDVKAASRAIDFLLGWFVAPVITGDYPPSMRNNVGEERLPKFEPGEVALVKGSCDFLGINYYTARYAKHVPRQTSKTHYQNDLHVVDHTYRNGKPIGDKGGSNWLYIVPEGIYKVMLHLKETYNNPEIIVTENGLDELKDDNLTVSEACKDETRVQYFKDHLAYLKKAMDSGVCLKGYYIWSFFDNFEWTRGYTIRFGVYHVNFKNEELERDSKSSAEWWTSFLEKQT